jgi:hypothetical protein
MGLKQCGKCSEMVDEAKAFCPGCGNAFVEEESRSDVSGFDSLDGTMQFGATMYNQMLSDMGLNISQTPDAAEKRVEVLTPTAAEPEPARPRSAPPPDRASPDRTKLFLLGGAAVIIILLLILAAIVLLLIYWPR